jgi:hypothetical protein
MRLLTGWQKDESKAVKPEDKFVHSHNCNQHYRMRPKGWKLCVKWKDGTTSWERLTDEGILSYQGS